MQQDEKETDKSYQVLYKAEVLRICSCLESLALIGQDIDFYARFSDAIKKEQPCETKDFNEYIRQLFHHKPSQKQRTTSIFISSVFGIANSIGFTI